MNKRKNWVYQAVMVSMFSAAMAVTSLAAEGVISSVTIRVESGLQPGETLPEVSIYNAGEESALTDGSIAVSSTADRYYISAVEWVTSTTRTMSVGDTPEMKVWLTPSGSAGDDYYFKGSYRSSNVTIKSGTFVSANMSGDQLVVRVKTRPIKGTFGAPSDAYWKDNTRGTAKWTKPEEDGAGSGSYEVTLRRGSSTVHKVETTNTSYNFYPYMTTAGTYTFRVRTIPKTSKEEQYGTKSEWIESDELYIAKEDVSDGSGKDDGNAGSTGPNGNTRVGWQLIDGSWYYYYPDGSYQKDSWMAVNGKWYLFQNDGKMLKGWQNRGNYTYFLTDNGDMYMGWIKNNNRWYYMSTAQDSTIGALVRNSWVVLNDKAYFMTPDGSMAEGWYQVNGNWYYFYPGQGHKAVNTYIDTFYVNGDGVWVK